MEFEVEETLSQSMVGHQFCIRQFWVTPAADFTCAPSDTFIFLSFYSFHLQSGVYLHRMVSDYPGSADSGLAAVTHTVLPYW